MHKLQDNFQCGIFKGIMLLLLCQKCFNNLVKIFALSLPPSLSSGIQLFRHLSSWGLIVQSQSDTREVLIAVSGSRCCLCYAIASLWKNVSKLQELRARLWILFRLWAELDLDLGAERLWTMFAVTCHWSLVYLKSVIISLIGILMWGRCNKWGVKKLPVLWSPLVLSFSIPVHFPQIYVNVTCSYFTSSCWAEDRSTRVGVSGSRCRSSSEVTEVAHSGLKYMQRTLASPGGDVSTGME